VSGTRDRRRALDRPREPLPTRVDDTPLLPAPYHRALDAGLRALEIELAPGQRRAIDAHVRLLLAWNRAINLTAVRDPAAVALTHVVDSLTALPVLRARGVERFVDLGSGAGFPGLPLAIALPARETLLVDSTGKKVRFIETVIDATSADLGADVHARARAERGEAVAREPDQRERWPAVTARAVAALADLVELAFPLLAPGGCLVAWKRGELDTELAAAARAAEALGGGSSETIDPSVDGLPGHRLIVLTKDGRSPDRYPRDPALRRRTPW